MPRDSVLHYLQVYEGENYTKHSLRPLRFPIGDHSFYLLHTGPKSRSRSIQTFTRLITSAWSRTVPKIITIGWTWALLRCARYNVFVCRFFSAFLGTHTVPMESSSKVNEGSKQVFLLQEVAFWIMLMIWIRKESKYQRPKILPPTWDGGTSSI